MKKTRSFIFRTLLKNGHVCAALCRSNHHYPLDRFSFGICSTQLKRCLIQSSNYATIVYMINEIKVRDYMTYINVITCIMHTI